MFGRFILSIYALLISSTLFSQTLYLDIDSTSKSIMPIECLSDSIYLEKYSTLSFSMFNSFLIRDSSIDIRKRIFERVEEYNLIHVKDFNEKTKELLKEFPNSLITATYSRDFHESTDETNRFIIVQVNPLQTNIKSEPLLHGDGYFLYDSKLKIRYKTFYSMAFFLTIREKSRRKFRDNKAQIISFNDFIRKKEKKSNVKYF